MRQNIRSAFTKEMNQARVYYQANEFDPCFSHLERAHILGQRYLLTHLLSHWWMLKVALKRSDIRELVGQITRIIAVVPGYLFGWVPKGNSGGANVSPIKPMPIPEDLAPMLSNYNVWKDVIGRLIFWCAVLLLCGIGA